MAFAAATYRLPGPTILSTRGTVCRAVGERGDRVRAADAKQARHPRLFGRRHHRRLRSWTHGDDVPDAGHPRRHGGHEQGRRERESAARHVAADTDQRLDTLLDRDAGRDRDVGMTRDLAKGDPRDVVGGLADGAPHRSIDAGRRGPDFTARHFQRSVSAVEPSREALERAIAAGAHR